MVMVRSNGWGRDHGLSLAPGKTEMLVLAKMRIHAIFLMHEGDFEVKAKRTAKYIRAVIDSRMTFGELLTKPLEETLILPGSWKTLAAHAPASVSCQLYPVVRRRGLGSCTHKTCYRFCESNGQSH